MSKVLVTGGAGFIGSHLTDKLIEKKHRVVVVDNLSTGKRKYVNPKARFYKVDVTSAKLAEVFNKEKPNIVFHLAAQKSVPFSVKNPSEDAKINIGGAINVIERSLESKIKKFIFISTGGAIYGEAKTIPTPETTLEQPDSPYGLSKLTVDNYLEKFYAKVKGLNYVSLRLSNVYGPRQDPFGEAGVIAIFINNLLNGSPCHINGSGRQTRDFIYVDEVIKAGLKAIRSGRGIYNIGTGQETAINDLYGKIADLIISRSLKKYRSALPGEVFHSALKCDKARRDLGWTSAVSLNEGIKKTIEFFKKS